jgi:hypothetical protein
MSAIYGVILLSSVLPLLSVTELPKFTFNPHVNTQAHTAATLSSITSLGLGLVIRISLPLIHTARNYNNYQTEVCRILITHINVYKSLANLHTPQIAATHYHFLGICPDLLHLQADMLSSLSQQCVCYLISHSLSAGEFQELFDCPL